MNKGIKHLVLSLIMRRTYRKSVDKKKENICGDNLDLVRLQYYARNKKKTWKRQSDKIGGLANCIQPPTIADVSEKGDCDDFASAIAGRFDVSPNAFIMTYFGKPTTKSHTVAVIAYGDQIVTFDWDNMYWFSSFKEMIASYEVKYNINISSVHLAQWSYSKYRYKAVSLGVLKNIG